MTAQIEREPRQGVELSRRRQGLERAALTLCFVLMAVLAWALLSLSPAACVIAAVLGFVCFVAADFIESEMDGHLDAAQRPRDK